MSPLRHVTHETPEELSPGDRLAELINEAGLNQTTLAKASGVWRETINRLVNDRHNMDEETAEALAPHLRVSPEYLLSLKAADVANRRELGRHLRSLEVEVVFLRELVHEGFGLLGLRVDPEADQGSRVSPANDQARQG